MVTEENKHNLFIWFQRQFFRLPFLLKKTRQIDNLISQHTHLYSQERISVSRVVVFYCDMVPIDSTDIIQCYFPVTDKAIK